MRQHASPIARVVQLTVGPKLTDQKITATLGVNYRGSGYLLFMTNTTSVANETIKINDSKIVNEASPPSRGNANRSL
jgi:hypothetical protein